MANKLFVSIDADDWYFARWATGSKNAYWPSINDCLLECYSSIEPPKQFNEAVDKVLSLFDSLNFSSTFFFTGYMAQRYPELVKKVAAANHEIGCHNWRHIDYEYIPKEEFKSDLQKSKSLLEDLSGQEIIGYRSPNSSIPNYLAEVLLDCGFKYDSSITPTRRIMGKFGNFTNAPTQPYFVNPKQIDQQGDSDLVEFPWPVFPYLKLPAGSGIMHRIGGSLYNNMAINHQLNKGPTCYYFHPYEIVELPKIDIKKSWKVHVFEQKIGASYYKSIQKFLTKHQSNLINGRSLLDNFKTNKTVK